MTIKHLNLKMSLMFMNTFNRYPEISTLVKDINNIKSNR